MGLQKLEDYQLAWQKRLFSQFGYKTNSVYTYRLCIRPVFGMLWLSEYCVCLVPVIEETYWKNWEEFQSVLFMLEKVATAFYKRK